MASINNLVSYELNGVKESFANWISNLSPTDTPFVSMTGKEAVKNKYFQWQEDQLGAFGANAEAEGSDAVSKGLKATTVRQNVTQILRKSVSVSDTANALSSYGRGKEMQYQLEKAGKEIKRDLEWAFLNQKASNDGASSTPISPATLGSSYVAQAFNATTGAPEWNQQTPYSASNVASGVRFTAGFEGLVAPVGAASPEDAAAIVHQIGDLTEENLFKVDEGLYLAGACPDIIMFHPKHAKFFSGLMETPNAHNRIRMFDGVSDTKVNTYVSTLVTPLGCQFKLIPNRFMPEDRIFFFRASDWTQMVLRAPTTQLLAKTGSHDKYMIEMEVGLRHKNQFASGILQLPSAAHTFSLDTGTGTVTQSGTTITVNAAPAAGDISIAVDPELASAIVAGSVVPTAATAVFKDFATDGFTVTIKAAGKTSGTIVADGTTYTVDINVAAPVVPPSVKSVTVTAPTTGTQKIGATGTAAANVVVEGTTPPAKTVTWSSSKAASISIVAGTGAWKVENAATVGEKVTLTATSTVDATKKGTVELTVGAPDLTGFTLAGNATGATFDANAKTLVFAKLADSQTDGIVLTPTAVPAKAVLGALSVTNADDTKAAATVAPAGKFTVKPVAVDTTGTTVTLKVAGAPDYVLTVTTLA